MSKTEKPDALPLHIIALQAENNARLKAVRIEPNGRLVLLTGKNAQGKSSVIKTIWMILGGKTKFDEVPIRVGETKMAGQLDIGDANGLKYRATLRLTLREDGSYNHTLTVENGDGARYGSPQEILKDMLGSLTFDPLAFVGADEEEQLKMMRAFVPGVDFAAIDKANKDDYAARTEVNRRVKELTAQAAAIIVPPGAPEARIDEDALVEKMAGVNRHNAAIDQRQANRDKVTDDIASMTAEAEELRGVAIDLRRKADEADAEAKKLDEAVAADQKRLDEAEALPERQDIDSVQAEITKARTDNMAFDRAQQKAAILADLKIQEDKAAALTKAMDDRTADMDAKVKAAKLPVEGLTLAQDRVLLDGLPLKQASDAQQLVLSLKVAAARNPRLRVATVRGGEKLDTDALALLAKTAEELDLQIWMERVDSSGKVGFVMEDGEVKGQEPFERLIKPEKPKKGDAATDGQGGE